MLPRRNSSTFATKTELYFKSGPALCSSVLYRAVLYSVQYCSVTARAECKKGGWGKRYGRGKKSRKKPADAAFSPGRRVINLSFSPTPSLPPTPPHHHPSSPSDIGCDVVFC